MQLPVASAVLNAGVNSRTQGDSRPSADDQARAVGRAIGSMDDPHTECLQTMVGGRDADNLDLSTVGRKFA